MTTPAEYAEIINETFRTVVKELLKKVAKDGLTGDSHFYLGFRTKHPGVKLAPQLKAKYPEEMVIVLQHQYWGLEVYDAYFSVTLSFSGVNECLKIPFAALTHVADPSAKFGFKLSPDVVDEVDIVEEPIVLQVVDNPEIVADNTNKVINVDFGKKKK